mgnify:CR=1 FL=1
MGRHAALLLCFDCHNLVEKLLMTRFHDLEMAAITGEPIPFERYKGQLCLAVNVASQ